MSVNVTIHFKDGSKHVFEKLGFQPGHKVLTLQAGFAIVEDAHGKRTIYPSADIEKIIEEPSP